MKTRTIVGLTSIIVAVIAGLATVIAAMLSPPPSLKSDQMLTQSPLPIQDILAICDPARGVADRLVWAWFNSLATPAINEEGELEVQFRIHGIICNPTYDAIEWRPKLHSVEPESVRIEAGQLGGLVSGQSTQDIVELGRTVGVQTKESIHFEPSEAMQMDVRWTRRGKKIQEELGVCFRVVRLARFFIDRRGIAKGQAQLDVEAPRYALPTHFDPSDMAWKYEMRGPQDNPVLVLRFSMIPGA